MNFDRTIDHAIGEVVEFHIYDEVKLECGFRADLLVNGQVALELKAKAANA